MPLTENLANELRKLRAQKKTLKEIARETKLSTATVSRYLKNLGIEKQPLNLDPNTIQNLYQDGYTINEIAKHFQVSHGVISRLLTKEGVTWTRGENVHRHFERKHDELWPNIATDLDKGIAKVTVANKYGIRIENLKRLMVRHHYQKQFTDDLSQLDQAFIDAEKLSGKAKSTRLRYLNAIRDYVNEHQEIPSKSNLAQYLHIAPATVSWYFNTYELNHLVKPTSTSNQVATILKVLQDNNIEYQLNRRDLLSNKQEIDIWLPHHNFGIEVNPVSTHTIDDPKWGFTKKNYHQAKSQQALNDNIALVHIYDTDLQSTQKWNAFKTRIQSLTENKPKIGARKCIVKEIDKKTSQEFLNRYHFQGADQSALHRFGMYYGDELIAVLTCGKSRFTSHTWELYRYCVNPHYIVHGAFDKLLKYFTKHYTVNCETLVTYMDLNKRFTISNIYERSGFILDGITPPNYVWVQRNTFDCKTRYETTKKKLVREGFDSNLSEIEIMRSRNYYRVYDAGSLRYIKKL